MFMLSCIAEAEQQANAANGGVAPIKQAIRIALPERSVKLDNHPVTITEMVNLSVTLQHARHVQTLRCANCNLSPDSLAILASRPMHVGALSLKSNPAVHGDGIRMFAQGVCTQGYWPSLLTLTLSRCGLGETDVMPLQKLLLQFPNLTNVRLSSNNFGSSAMCTLKNALIHSKIQYLSLHDNPVLGANLGGQAMAEVICNPCLQIVDLDNTNATTATVHHLLAELHRFGSVRKLRLGRNKIDDGIVEVLAASLNKRQSVRSHPGGQSLEQLQDLTIILHLNKISVNAVQRLASLMPSGCSDRVEINSMVVGNGTVVERNWAAVTQQHADQLKRDVDFRGQGLRGRHVADISNVLKDRHIQLSTLNLSHNRIGDEGLCALADAVKTNTSLKALSVGNNDFGEAGVSAMATALSKHNSTLCYLDLGSSRILRSRHGYVKVDDIAALVGLCKGLKFLRFNNSGLSEKEGEVIGEALALPSCALEFFCMRANTLRNTGTIALSQGLRANISLKYLDLSDNEIGDDGAASMASCAHTRAESDVPLQQVWMGDNPIDSSAFSGCIMSGHFRRSPSVSTSLLEITRMLS